MKKNKIAIIDHYKKLWFFNFNRFKGDNYDKMCEYFANVFVEEMEEFISLWNKKVLDVGGSKGEFSKFLNKTRKCEAINLDPYPGKYVWPKTVIEFADNMSFKDNEFDLILCRGVLEHIRPEKQQKSVDEMYRVTKKGGFGYIMIPPWYNPHAGHSLKPFHIFPFKMAKFLKQLTFRRKIKGNSFEEINLYSITFRKMRKMILKSGFKIVSTKDTHLRLHVLTKIPLLREVLVPGVAFILKKE